jgi:hypothetical protein
LYFGRKIIDIGAQPLHLHAEFTGSRQNLAAAEPVSEPA